MVALSTDKAANPINLYGATKLCSDKLFVAGNSYAGGGGTRFSCVRYGNVVGSRGSVIPFFLEQRETAGVLPITDARMTRFWITLEQGVRFVLQLRSSCMHGGEIFVPKIPSMNIIDLAEARSRRTARSRSSASARRKAARDARLRGRLPAHLEFPDFFTIRPTRCSGCARSSATSTAMGVPSRTVSPTRATTTTAG